MKSAVQSAKTAVDEPVLRVEQYENEAWRLVLLVENECAQESIADIIATIRQNILSPYVNDDERRKRFSTWINAVDTKATYETALQRRHDRTCEWVLQLDQFVGWASPQSTQAKLLWLHGPPGFGKTFISAWITQHLIKNSQQPVVSFFCVADNQPSRDPYAILRSWISQLLDQCSAVLPLVASFFAFRPSKDQILTHLELWKLFDSIGEGIPECTFILDGFDECVDINSGVQYHTNDPRSDFLRDLLSHVPRTAAHVLVVSRNVPDIKGHLSQSLQTTPTLKMYEYEISAKDTSADVAAFSESMVNQRLPKKNAALKDKIAKEAAKRSEGMFLWINLLEKEISPGQNAKELHQTVLEMPSRTSEAYSREIDRIMQLPLKQKSKALTVLRWVLFAVRPLQLKELAEALIVSGDDNDDLDEYPFDDLPDTWEATFVDDDYVNEAILGRCGSLLQTRSRSPHEPLADHTVHFVHFSVKEYFTSLPRTDTVSQALNLVDMGAEETRLSKICLRYLALSTFEEIPPNIKSFPFLRYAAWAWYYHAFRGKPPPSKDIMDRTQRVFNPTTSNWKTWTPVLEVELNSEGHQEAETLENYAGDGSCDVSVVSETRTTEQLDSTDEMLAERILPSFELRFDKLAQFRRPVQNPVYYVSFLGLEEVVKWLEDQGLDCNSDGGQFGFPLQAAVVGGHGQMVSHLLRHNVSVLQKGGRFGAAIVAAAALSTPEIVQSLLNAGADLTVTDENGWAALHHASRRGNAHIVEQLLDNCADINSTTPTGMTAASLAGLVGNTEVLSILIARKADLGITNKRGITALHFAIANGHESVACNLIDAGAPVNDCTHSKWTPLSLAVIHNFGVAVKKLLDKNAIVNHISPYNQTMLHQAAGVADLEIVKALLDAGAELSCTDNEGATPLHIAVLYDRPEIISQLLDYGSDIEQAVGGVSASYLAVQSGHRAALELLLNRGASIQGIAQTTLLSMFDVAVIHKNLDVAELLVERGCLRGKHLSTKNRSDTQDAESLKSRITAMSLHGDENGLKCLLDKRRRDVSQETLNEALAIVATRGFVEMALSLLELGASINRKDVNGRTALHGATCHAEENMANALVEKGASLVVEDDLGSTPLDLAATNGQELLDFITRHLGEFRRSIQKRPSLLENPGARTSSLTTAEIRQIISGAWKGYYSYLSWEEGRKEETSFSIPSAKALDAKAMGLPDATFSSEDNKDEWDIFQIHGLVDTIGVVWFVKLYRQQGWLYRGRLDPDLRTLRGAWGSNRKLWYGTFEFKLVEAEGAS